MPTLDLGGLDPGVARVAEPFLGDLLEALGDQVVSLAVVGAAAGGKFDRNEDEVNSVVILKDLQVRHLRAIAPLGKKHGRKGVAAPFILTPSAIQSSRDVFAVEYLSFRLAHKTVFGPDLLSELEVEKEHLRLQVERELKAALIRMRQGFIRSAGDPRLLLEVITDVALEIFPQLRAILHLLGKPISLDGGADLVAVSEAVGVEGEVPTRVLLGDGEKEKPTLEEVESRFSSLYEFLHALSEKVDAGLG